MNYKDEAGNMLAAIRKRQEDADYRTSDRADEVEPPRKSRAERLRDKNPALKDAWDKYQVMLKLVDSSLPPEEETAEDLLDMIRARRATVK